MRHMSGAGGQRARSLLRLARKCARGSKPAQRRLARRSPLAHRPSLRDSYDVRMHEPGARASSADAEGLVRVQRAWRGGVLCLGLFNSSKQQSAHGARRAGAPDTGRWTSQVRKHSQRAPHHFAVRTGPGAGAALQGSTRDNARDRRYARAHAGPPRRLPASPARVQAPPVREHARQPTGGRPAYTQMNKLGHARPRGVHLSRTTKYQCPKFFLLFSSRVPRLLCASVKPGSALIAARYAASAPSMSFRSYSSRRPRL